MSKKKVLDVYFQFAAAGDFYLGQLLSLKDPNSMEFDTPCPCWHNLNNPVVAEAPRIHIWSNFDGACQ